MQREERLNDEGIGPSGADEFEDGVGGLAPGDLNDEADVEAGTALQSLHLLGDRGGGDGRGAVEHGDVDLDVLITVLAPEADPLLAGAVLDGERPEALRRLCRSDRETGESVRSKDRELRK